VDAATARLLQALWRSFPVAIGNLERVNDLMR
jgi:hypothetical protein